MISDDVTPPTLLQEEQVSIASDFDPVSLGGVKEYVQVEHSQDDFLFMSLVESAIQIFEDYTNRYLKGQVRRAVFDRVVTRYRLPTEPVRSLDAVETTDEGAVTSEDESEWWLENVSPPEVKAKDAMSVSDTKQTIRFEYKAGYASQEEVPESMKLVLKKIVGDLYEYRTSKGEGLNRQLTEQPAQWSDLLTGHKVPYYNQPTGGRESSFFL